MSHSSVYAELHLPERYGFLYESAATSKSKYHSYRYLNLGDMGNWIVSKEANETICLVCDGEGGWLEAEMRGFANAIDWFINQGVDPKDISGSMWAQLWEDEDPEIRIEIDNGKWSFYESEKRMIPAEPWTEIEMKGLEYEMATQVLS